MPAQGVLLEGLIAATSSIGFFLYGFDQGVYAGLIKCVIPRAFTMQQPIFLRRFPATRDPLTQSAVVAVLELGAFIGALLVACFGSVLGRKKCIAYGAAAVLLGGGLQTCSFDVVQLVIGRFVAGLGIGSISSTTPVWQSELAKPSWRGKLVMLQGAFIVLGVATSYWLNWAMYEATSSEWQWRAPVAIQLAPAGLLLFGIINLVESPRWLLLVGREEEAEDVVARLYGGKKSDKHVQVELDGMKQSVEAMNEFRWSDLLHDGPEKNRYRASVSLAAQTFQQLAGTNLVTYFQTVLFRQLLNFKLRTSLVLTALSGTEYFVSAIIAIFVIDRVGRRGIMAWTAAGQACVMLALGICVYVKTTTALYIGVACIVLFNTFFALGWQATTWLYCAELPNLKTRTTVSALGACSNWALNSVVVLAADPLMHYLGGGTYLIFAFFNLAFLPFILLFFPETARRGLEEIDLIMAKAHASNESPVKVAAEMEEKDAETARDELQQTVDDGEATERDPLLSR